MASDSNDDVAYLNPEFDLSSLTVPRLRSILVNHDVPYPASAKKSQLIAILQTEVIPQAKKLLRERERVKRTSKGITDMSSSRNSGSLKGGDDDDDRTARGSDRDSMPPPSTPATVRRGRSKNSTRASTADTDDSAVPPPSTSRKRTATKHARASETTGSDDADTVEATPRRSSRKSRKSEAFPTPRASTVDSDELPVSIKRELRDGSVFTDDNPFQSGSPASERSPQRPRTSSTERRRKSSARYSTELTPTTEERRKRKSAAALAKAKQEDGVKVPTRDTFDVYSDRLMTPKIEEESDDDDDEEVEASEEFTPEEQLSLDQDEVKAGGRYEATPRRRRPQKQGKVAKTLSWLIILSLVGGFGAWWRREKIEIGYCGVGKSHWSLAETNVPEWADVLEPQCEPCPQHAFCYPEFDARCEQDFFLKSHPLSLGGLIPLPPTCEPDGEKARRVKSVVDKAIGALREQRAKWECGHTGKSDGTEAVSPQMTASELRDEVTKQKRKGMSEEEFEELWRGALGELSGREEVITSTAEG